MAKPSKISGVNLTDLLGKLLVVKYITSTLLPTTRTDPSSIA